MLEPFTKATTSWLSLCWARDTAFTPSYPGELHWAQLQSRDEHGLHSTVCHLLSGTQSCGLQLSGTQSCDLQLSGTQSCGLQLSGTQSCGPQGQQTDNKFGAIVTSDSFSSLVGLWTEMHRPAISPS